MTQAIGLSRNAIGVIGNDGLRMLFRQANQGFRHFGQLLSQVQQVIAHDCGTVRCKHVLT